MMKSPEQIERKAERKQDIFFETEQKQGKLFGKVERMEMYDFDKD